MCVQSYLAKSQDATIYRNMNSGSLCSSSITLLKGGSFVYESGCEESSRTCFGKWYKSANTVTLVPQELKDFVIVKYFEAGPVKEGLAKLKVLDKTGQDMSHKMKFTLLDSLHKEVFTTTSWEEATRAPFIRLTTLKNIFNVGIDLDNSSPRNNLLQISIPAHFIPDQHAVWQVPPVLQYRVEADCLVEMKPGGSQMRYCP